MSQTNVLDVLDDTLAYARNRDYVGWDYADGMSSRFRQWLPFETRATNLVFQETAKRAPVNVRPLLLVEQRRNFMGSGLFAMANLNARQLVADGHQRLASEVDYADEAATLLDWAIQHRCRNYSGFCGSHQHELQALGFKGDTSTPSIVSTAFPAMALVRAADVDPVFPAVGRTAADFVVTDLNYREMSNGAAVDYLPDDSGDYVTPNAMAVGARYLTELFAFDGDEAVGERATRILRYVADLQTNRGGWMYRHPPESSHLSMDNFHNGFIIEALLRYGDLVDGDRFSDVLDRALSFYRETLFEADGAPNWDEDTSYPRDIHAVAQGILVFSDAGEFDRAGRILSWALENLYAGDGQFYQRQTRWYTKRVTLMRWCQAWMALALSAFARRALDAGRSDALELSPEP